jgi:hypothetical protein
MLARPGSHHRTRRLAAVLAATALAAPAAAGGQPGFTAAVAPPDPAPAAQPVPGPPRLAQAPVPGPARGRGLVRTFSAPAETRDGDRFDWEAAGLGAGTAGALGLLVLSGLHARARAPRRLVG